MRIGFDAKRAFTNSSGLGNYSRFVISGLLRQFPQESYFLYTPAVRENFVKFYPAAPAVHLRQPRAFGAWWRSFGLKKNLRHDGVQLFHGLSNELPVGLEQANIRQVVTLHDLIFLRFPELYPPLDRLIYSWKFRHACRVADQIVAISHQTKIDIEAYFGTSPEKITVVYQDCDPLFHQPATPEVLARVKQQYNLPDQFVLCVGTLEPRKNQLHLLRAWWQADLPRDLPLVFVGRPTTYKKLLEQFIRKNCLQRKVLFLPYVPTAELPAIYQLAHLFVYPSVFEGFGIPILEGLNSGVPVVTSTGSCFAEAGGEAALYAAPDDPEELAGVLQQAAADSDLRQRMVRQGKEQALRFRASSTIPQLHQLYQQTLYS